MMNGKGGKSMGMKAKGGGGKERSKYDSDICYSLGLGGSSHPVSIFGKGKGKGKGRQRELQTCSPNAHDLVSSNPNLSIFLRLLEATGLEEILRCEGPLTVLAPSNQSFEKNPDLLQSLFNPRNSALVRDMLLHHFIPDYLLERDFSAGPIDSLLGAPIEVQKNPLMFDQAGVLEADLTTCNAVVHIIDDPLIPDGKYFRFLVAFAH